MKLLIVAISAVMLSACATAPTEPEVTFDGLVQVPDTRLEKVYRLPGADLSGYVEFGLAPCEVSFRKNWLRDQNRSNIDLTNRVTQEDVNRIRDVLAEECTTYFRQALLEAPAYNVVEDFENGQDVLVVKPAIIDLDINAPDIMSPGVSRSYTTSSGEMTLSLELVDGTTGQVLARVVDRRRGRDTGRLEWTNGVTNRAEADRTLKRWAGMLREGLDTATGR